MALLSINPATGQKIAGYDAMSTAEVEEALEGCHGDFLAWRSTPLGRRAEPLRRAAEILRARRRPLAELMTAEMGKPVLQGEAEAEKCAAVCEYYADRGADFLAEEPLASDAGESFVSFRPLGVVLAVMPWNFPLWQVFRFAAPTLMAGNGALLKHAPNVMGCALEIEGILRQAGFPEHLFRALRVEERAVASLLEDPRVRAVTLTGSGAAGRAVAAKAGEQLKKSVLELGGSDPYVVLDDADLAHAAKTCVDSRLINSGQSCIAAKRFIVVSSRRREFEALVLEHMRAKRLGDPADPATDIGPQARRDLRDALDRQVAKSIERGAALLLGGEVPEGPGAFYPATVLTDVAPGMPAYEEELFGPVASILIARDEEDALRLANDTSFGLGAAVFTRDAERGRRIAAERLEAGCCFVNDFVRSDPRLPFGGIGQSGYGRELSAYGIREFVNVKTVFVR